MTYLRSIVLIFTLIIIIALPENGHAQCSMCTLNAEASVENGNTEGNGLNDAILYLLAAPYLAIGAVGFLWYKKYRTKSTLLSSKDGNSLQEI